MDILQFQPILEKLLNHILTQSPNTIEQVKHILIMIIQGVHLVGTLGTIISQHPELTILASKLLDLILAGASIHEIVIALVNFANSLGLSLELIVQLLQIIGGMLVAF